MVMEKKSDKTVAASANVTPCLCSFETAFLIIPFEFHCDFPQSSLPNNIQSPRITSYELFIFQGCPMAMMVQIIEPGLAADKALGATSAPRLGRVPFCQALDAEQGCALLFFQGLADVVDGALVAGDDVVLECVDPLLRLALFADQAV